MQINKNLEMQNKNITIQCDQENLFFCSSTISALAFSFLHIDAVDEQFKKNRSYNLVLIFFLIKTKEKNKCCTTRKLLNFLLKILFLWCY